MTSSDKPAEGHDALHRAVRDAMLDLGWIPPSTEQEFLELEAHVREEPPIVPPELQAIADPLDAQRFSDEHAPDIIPFPRSETEQNLARVAREGGVIPPDVLDRMQRDRRDAEDKANGG